MYLLERDDSLPAVSVGGDGEDGGCVSVGDGVNHGSVLSLVLIVGSDPTHCLTHRSRLWHIQLVTL